MNIKIYAIGGKKNGDFVGTATDSITFLSLIELVSEKNGYAVGLHGDLGPKSLLNRIVSGEYSLNDAKELVNCYQVA